MSPPPPKKNHRLLPYTFFCITWLLKRGYLGYSFPFYQLKLSGKSALTSGMFFHRTAAHWMFSLFKNFLCKHQSLHIWPLYFLALPVAMLCLNLNRLTSEWSAVCSVMQGQNHSRLSCLPFLLRKNWCCDNDSFKHCNNMSCRDGMYRASAATGKCRTPTRFFKDILFQQELKCRQAGACEKYEDSLCVCVCVWVCVCVCE